MTLDVGETEAEEGSVADELSGSMGSDPDDERLAHSVLEHDDQTVKDGQLLAESVDYAVGSFTPDLLFEQITKNYRNAQRLFGETIIRELTGYDADFVEKNVKINEFREQIRQNIHANIQRLQDEGLLDEDGKVTREGLQLASLVLYTEELDHLQTKGLGKKDVKEKAHYGEKDERVPFRKHRYKDLDLRGSITQAIRRGRKRLEPADLRAVTRIEHGRISIVYAVDASGSMRGEKLHLGKKAGIALAYKAIDDRNDVGMVVFTSKIQESIPPCHDFPRLLVELTKVRAGHETDLALAIEHATSLFSRGVQTKHVVLLTDALPTRGKEPGKLTMEAVAAARDAGVTISLVGINLEKEGETLAKDIVELGNGKLYRCTNLAELDTIILEDYESLKG